MRSSAVEERSRFLLGMLIGLIAVLAKFVIALPVDVADILYGMVLLVTLVITAGEVMRLKFFVLEAKILDLIVGLLFPLDIYAVLILFGIALPN